MPKGTLTGIIQIAGSASLVIWNQLYHALNFYENQLRLLNILPLPMYMQMNDFVSLSKLTQEGRDLIEVPEINKV